MFEVRVLIPVADNNGLTFTAGDHAAYEAFVVERFGGVTLFPSGTSGSWFGDEGKLYRDESRDYGIAMRSITQGAELAEVIAFAKRHYRQEAIFIRYLGVAEIA